MADGSHLAGKSTFLGILESDHVPFICVPEPLSKWRRVSDTITEEAAAMEENNPTCSQENGGFIFVLCIADSNQETFLSSSIATLRGGRTRFKRTRLSRECEPKCNPSRTTFLLEVGACRARRRRRIRHPSPASSSSKGPCTLIATSLQRRARSLSASTTSNGRSTRTGTRGSSLSSPS